LTVPERTLQELAQHLADGKAQGEQHPRFALFLGAGASIESGIPGTESMVQHFQERLSERWRAEGAKGDFDDWLKSRPGWESKAGDYSNLFEAYEPTQFGRARHIEALVAKGTPNFGYLCLSQLLDQGYLDTVITTNFDDLAYEASALWSSVRPRVYAYGVTGGPIRRQSGRPSIIKLHGDFLYSRLKNTSAELAQQDPNMKTQVGRLLDDYELMVIGYNGNDASVMRILEAIPDAAGVYWCVYKDQLPSRRTQRLLKRQNWALVRTNGFESIMDELLHSVNFVFPELERTVREQREDIFRIITESGSLYKMQFLGEAVKAAEAEAERPAPVDSAESWQAVLSHAISANNRGDAKGTITSARRALELRPDDAYSVYLLGRALVGDDQVPEGIATLRHALELEPTEVFNLIWLGMALVYAGQMQEAVATLRHAQELRPDDVNVLNTLGYVLREDGQVQEAITTLRRAQELRPDDTAIHGTLGITLYYGGEREQAEQIFGRALEITSSRSPDDLVASQVRGLALLGLGQWEEALHLFQEMIDRRPQPAMRLRDALTDLRPLAQLGVAGAQECIALIEGALGQ
jgi:Flp pilus assembly protein TadD